jgi:hypothetical protein
MLRKPVSSSLLAVWCSPKKTDVATEVCSVNTTKSWEDVPPTSTTSPAPTCGRGGGSGGALERRHRRCTRCTGGKLH